MNLPNYLPIKIRPEIDEYTLKNAEEIRIRAGRPLEILYADGESKGVGCISEVDLRETLNYLCGYSPYSMEEELRQGYFTIEGGHRVGVSGRASFENKNTVPRVNTISDIGAINIRIAHEKKGCAKALIPWIRRDGKLFNTFIFSPPGVGKTTFLRDSIRLLSTGDKNHAGVKVGVVDERSEIAACHCGVPQNDLGPRADVLDNCPKPIGIMMLLRSMSPEIIAVDELGGKEDFRAMSECAKSGAAVLGTIHAGTKEEAYAKLFCGSSITEHTQLVEIIRRPGGTRAIKIYGERGKILWQN